MAARADRVSGPDEPRFIMDFSLFRVAKQLRLLGYDAVCSRSIPHAQIVPLAQRDRRTLITASTRITPHLDRLQRQAELSGPVPTARRRVIVGYNSDGESEYESESDGIADCDVPVKYVMVNTNQSFRDQLASVLQDAGIEWNPKKIFTRCVTCNVLIGAVPDKEHVRPLVNPTVFGVYDRFYQCPSCDNVYWGMDDGVIVNFKALRTIEHLKNFCRAIPRTDTAASLSPTNAPASWNATGLRRHFLAYPRAVKVAIFTFLLHAELDVVRSAFPMLTDLVNVVQRGESTKFVPDFKRFKLRKQAQGERARLPPPGTPLALDDDAERESGGAARSSAAGGATRTGSQVP